MHLAALPSVPRSVLDPVASHHANATGTLEVLQAARRAGDLHVVVASSSSVYGANRELPKREGMRTAPISPYAVSKQAAEAYAMSFGHTYGLPTLAFRFFNVYGPLQAAGHAYAAVVPGLRRRRAARGARSPSTATASRPATSPTWARSPASSPTPWLARSPTRSRSTSRSAPAPRSTPSSTSSPTSSASPREVEHVEPRAGDVRDSQADNARLRHHFPDVEPVPLREGLQQTVDWFRTLPDHRA